MVTDPFDPFDNVCACVRECWRCGIPLTHEDDHLDKCPVCGDTRLVPYGTRFAMTAGIVF
jgi:hypothetical protein